MDSLCEENIKVFLKGGRRSLGRSLRGGEEVVQAVGGMAGKDDGGPVRLSTCLPA